ncbi:hypothetical protein CSA37_08665 [Candidatus Fermentibacteria bacterium]|nr:MAG: hypothetical protein CSA37_08665 [Candidatus Fermentibacteria bacterium]
MPLESLFRNREMICGRLSPDVHCPARMRQFSSRGIFGRASRGERLRRYLFSLVILAAGIRYLFGKVCAGWQVLTESDRYSEYPGDPEFCPPV